MKIRYEIKYIFKCLTVNNENDSPFLILISQKKAKNNYEIDFKCGVP